MSHCEWKPLTDEQKNNEFHHVWIDGWIEEAIWRGGCWQAEARPHDFYPLDPQPKYYLAVTPPPED